MLRLHVAVRLMCFFFSLIPATIWAVIGFFILFASTKTEGTI